MVMCNVRLFDSSIVRLVVWVVVVCVVLVFVLVVVDVGVVEIIVGDSIVISRLVMREGKVCFNLNF